MAEISGSDLAKLEYEFATKPNSHAFIPLAEAYLDMGRYVEAMVVCKKGIKSNPELPTARLIMARIYESKGNLQKSLDEIEKLMELDPSNGTGMSMRGQIYIKLNRQDEGITALKQAMDLDPGLASAKDALLKLGVDYVPQMARPAAPAQGPAPVAAPLAAPGQAAIEATANRGIHPPPPVVESQTTPATDPSALPRPGARKSRRAAPVPDHAPAPTQVPAPVAGTPVVPAAPFVPAATQPAPRRRKRIADVYQEMEERNQKERSKGRGLRRFLITAVGLALVLVGYLVYQWRARVTQDEINLHLETANPGFQADTYPGYQKALAEYKEVLKIDKDHQEVMARVALIESILVGEFGENRDLLTEAAGLIAKAKQEDPNRSNLVVAEALSLLYGAGSTQEAIGLLEAALKNEPDSATLNTTLGLVFLKKGEMGKAKDALLKGASMQEKRALYALGLYAMQRSMFREASSAFKRTVQAEKDHARAILMDALVAMLWSDTARANQGASGGLSLFKESMEATASKPEKDLASLIQTLLDLRKQRDAGKRPDLTSIGKFAKEHSASALFQYALARELRRFGDKASLDKAKELIAIAMRQESTRPDVVLEESTIFLALSDFEGARSRALRLQEMDTESGQAHLIIGDAYLGERKYDKAEEYYREAKKFDDTEALSYLRMAELYRTQPKPDEDRAQAQFELAIPGLAAMGDSRKAAEASVQLARIYERKGRVEEFKNSLQQAIRADNSYAPPFCIMGGALNVNVAESLDAAREYCKDCVRLDPAGGDSRACRELLKRYP